MQGDKHLFYLTISSMPTKRIEYIDAMRGFTIFLVVLQHVSIFVLMSGNLEAFFFSKIFMIISMPLFFLISGFVLYKKGDEWNLSNTLIFFRKKLPVLILSPFLFFFSFVSIRHLQFFESINGLYKAGYWFTFVLFEFYVFYALLNWIIRFCKLEGFLTDVVLILGGGIVYFFCIYGIFAQLLPEEILGLLSVDHWYFFFYLIVGVLVRKNYEKFELLNKSQYFATGCIVVFFSFNLFPSWFDTSPTLYNFFMRLSGLFLVFAVFSTHQNIFSSSHRVGRIFQFLGRRTLDIYLIHYFFLFTNLRSVLPDFSNLNTPLVELFVGTAVAILIIMASLLVSFVLRTSPLLAHWMFGQMK